MAKRSPPEEAGGDDDWLCTYADAITILMAFFVLLYSMSTPDEGRFDIVRAGILKAFAAGDTTESTEGAEKTEEKVKETPDFDKVVSELVEKLKDLEEDKTLQIYNFPKGIKLEFNSNALYRAGSATIRPKSKPIIKRIAGHILELKGTPHMVVVEGHTDDIPIRTRRFPSNWELSTSRATNIVRSFLKHGISRERLMASGYADMKPKAPNRDSEGKPIKKNQAKNRRIVINLERY